MSQIKDRLTRYDDPGANPVPFAHGMVRLIFAAARRSADGSHCNGNGTPLFEPWRLDRS
jgi:hypothetical protein